MEEDIKSEVSSSAILTQPLQYIVIETSNGMVQAVPTQSIVTTASSGTNQLTTSQNNQTNTPNIRPSIAIAPKIEPTKSSNLSVKPVSRKSIINQFLQCENQCYFLSAGDSWK